MNALGCHGGPVQKASNPFNLARINEDFPHYHMLSLMIFHVYAPLNALTVIYKSRDLSDMPSKYYFDTLIYLCLYTLINQVN